MTDGTIPNSTQSSSQERLQASQAEGGKGDKRGHPTRQAYSWAFTHRILLSTLGELTDSGKTHTGNARGVCVGGGRVWTCPDKTQP